MTEDRFNSFGELMCPTCDHKWHGLRCQSDPYHANGCPCPTSCMNLIESDE